jgi:uncharacterized protein YegP (UPF0339 family)
VENGGTKKRASRGRKPVAKAPVALPVPEPRVRAEVYAGRKLGRQKWRFRVSTLSNGKKLAQSSEAYTNKTDCVIACRIVVGPGQHIEGADS